jgi:hypothetical protein
MPLSLTDCQLKAVVTSLTSLLLGRSSDAAVKRRVKKKVMLMEILGGDSEAKAKEKKQSKKSPLNKLMSANIELNFSDIRGKYSVPSVLTYFEVCLCTQDADMWQNCWAVCSRIAPSVL